MSVLISTHHKDKVKPRILDMSPEQEEDRYKKPGACLHLVSI